MRASSVLLFLAACGKDVETPGPEGHPEEVITTVVLSLTSDAGPPIEAAIADPENDGSPIADPIVLLEGTAYDVTVTFLNELEAPPEDITVEVAAESDEHQVFFTGSSVAAGLVAYAYDDEDANGHPVGLAGTLSALAAGEGTFVVTLRHLPPESEVPVKTGTLAEDAATGGIESLPGASDVSVSLDLTVSAEE